MEREEAADREAGRGVEVEKDVLEREDMVEVLGPWAEKTSYDDIDDDDVEDSSLSIGLHGWDSPVTIDDEAVKEEVKEPVVFITLTIDRGYLLCLVSSEVRYYSLR